MGGCELVCWGQNEAPEQENGRNWQEVQFLVRKVEKLLKDVKKIERCVQLAGNH